MENKSLPLALGFIFICVLAVVAFLKYRQPMNPVPQIPDENGEQVNSFEECVAKGNPVMESYPPRCSHNGKTFTQDIGNEMEKANLIRVETPRPNTKIYNPLMIKGEARGPWYFEASFPVYIYDSTGREVASGAANAQGEWMTEEFVPFTATINFEKPMAKGKGTLILRKSNPSGMPDNDDELRIPVDFE